MRFGDVVVVFEGRRRIAWSRTGFAEWTPVAIWPDSRNGAAIRRRIAVREPVLVVVEAPEAAVTILADQLAAAPPAVAALAERDGEVADVRIPAFDWLPEDLRSRGLAFLRSNAERAQRIPAPLLPPVVLEESAGHVRFLHVMRPWEQLERDLDAIAELAFGTSLRAAA
jgi:transposase